ncbi:hypothetical protein LIER_20541 [Lithospermum erythrorhizon]|uniref:Uncharacterized protein n=1 Tax=Lithospermum erythrorhizon TaxID=34254 RepID=A0AAV3QPA4_LITER
MPESHTMCYWEDRGSITVMQFAQPYINQCLKYYKSGTERTIKADENPFSGKESHFAEAKYYQKKKITEPYQQENSETPKVESSILP